VVRSPLTVWNASLLEELSIPIRLSRLTPLVPPPTGIELFALRRNFSHLTNSNLGQSSTSGIASYILPTACLWMHDRDLDVDLDYLRTFIAAWRGSHPH
jgi:hypothetical protein